MTTPRSVWLMLKGKRTVGLHVSRHQAEAHMYRDPGTDTVEYVRRRRCEQCQYHDGGEQCPDVECVMKPDDYCSRWKAKE